MINYTQEMDLYFELKGTPESSKESYFRRLKAFVEYVQTKSKDIEDIDERDIQEYILYLKREKALTAGTINNYISAIRFFYTHVLGQRMGNYTRRIAISNSRMVSVGKDSVTFTVKDRKTGKTKPLTLPGVEFTRRFLMHLLPKGFVKIRHYGLLASRNKKTKLALCRKLTNSPATSPSLKG